MEFDAYFNDQTKVCEYSKDVFRVVETQEYAATLTITNDGESQRRLEDLLDDIKPSYKEGTENYHYLIKTAFRYPPLKYGSRFGTKMIPSYFYASESIEGSLYETAYYRFLLTDAHLAEAYTKPVTSEHDIFSVKVASNKCLDLCEDQYSEIREHVSSPLNYSITQKIGDWLDNVNTAEMLRFYGARPVKERYVNVAIKDPLAIKSLNPEDNYDLKCRISEDRVSFSSRKLALFETIYKEDFCINGEFPVIQ